MVLAVLKSRSGRVKHNEVHQYENSRIYTEPNFGLRK